MENVAPYSGGLADQIEMNLCLSYCQTRQTEMQDNCAENMSNCIVVVCIFTLQGRPFNCWLLPFAIIMYLYNLCYNAIILFANHKHAFTFFKP